MLLSMATNLEYVLTLELGSTQRTRMEVLFQETKPNICWRVYLGISGGLE